MESNCFVIYTPLVFECFVKKKRILSLKNVNKQSVKHKGGEKKKLKQLVLSIK